MAQPQSTPTSPAFDVTPLVQAATQATMQVAQRLPQQAQGQAQALEPMLKAFTKTAEALATRPHSLMQRGLELHQSHLALGATMLERMLGRTPAPVIVPEKDDRRFAHEGWNEAVFDLLKQSYLLTSKWLLELSDEAPGLSPHEQMQVQFYTRQITDALSPSNFLPTNPEAIATALSTQGESLKNGFQNFLADLSAGKISMTDTTKFKVGENLAVTPGQVVYRNPLIELIQYTPTTDKVHAIPLLISPPWINRFYILDLQQNNSLVKYYTDQGYQVFMISWKNPDASYKNVGFEDYITTGLIPAIEATLAITGQETLNAVGYCIGGTLMASTVAALNAMHPKKQDPRINSVTFFTTLVDFAQAGELGVFIDEEQLQKLEAQMQRDGVLDGASMAGTFSALRANDLVWSFVVNQYLMGKQPFPFDILYWNGDSTRMPCAMHSWYLRQLYLENNLVKKGKLKLLGTPIDITLLTQPLYMVSAQNDHITPWESCYGAFARMQSPSKRFVLSKAGHVAGVVNPPTPEGKPVKRSFKVAEASSPKPDNWLETAKETPDSWWPDFAAWLKPLSGAQVAAPKKAGNAQYKPLCAAPGTYVVE